MALVQTPSEICTDPRHYMMMIVGDAGVGKTTFGSQIPEHYFLKAEEGTQGVAVYGEPINNWRTFTAKVKELIDVRMAGFPGQRRIEVVVVDTVDVLFRMCAQHVLQTETFTVGGKAMKYAHMEDVPFGLCYNRTAAAYLIPTLNSLHLAGYGVLLLCHSGSKTVKWMGQEVEVSKPRIGGNIAPELLVDACGVVGYFKVIEQTRKNAQTGAIELVEQKRVGYFQPTFQAPFCKHRLRGFPAEIPLVRDSLWADYCKHYQETLNDNAATTTATTTTTTKQ